MKNLFLLIIIIFFSFSAGAQGDLLVTPRRVVFEGNKQKEVLHLLNVGSEENTYTVSFVQKNMKEDGSFVDITEPGPGQQFADSYLRLFPRRITLAPNEGQSIVLQYRRKADMVEGEYRSHLYFRSEKDYTALGDKSKNKSSNNLSVQLIPVFGMSIPVIIRTGETHVTATLSDLKLETQGETLKNLSFTINRSGNISLYGDILVQFVPENGKAYDVASLNGVGVYTNIDKRNVTVRFNNVASKPFKKGKLKVTYSSDGDGKTIVYATADLVME
jgi:hypothetical protein